MDNKKVEQIKKCIEEKKSMYIFCAQTSTYLKVKDDLFWEKIKKLLEEIANE
jgi:hypothetical protein